MPDTTDAHVAPAVRPDDADLIEHLEGMLAAPSAPPTVPLLDGPQAQGDVLVVPTDRPLPYTAQPLPHDRTIPIVESGHGHILRADRSGGGIVLTAPVRDGHVVAVVEITPGACAYLEQPTSECGGHPNVGLAPGRYEIRRQMQASRPHWWIFLGDAISGWAAD